MNEEYSNRIPQLIDPFTGEVRPAGSFSNTEWNRILRNNPDAATLILQLRRKEEELKDAQIVANDAIGTGIGAVSAGISYPLLQAVAPETAQRLAVEWRDRTWAQPNSGDDIYKGDRVRLGVNDKGTVELTVDGQTVRPSGRKMADTMAINREISNAKQAIPGYFADPQNRRFYVAAPVTEDGLGAERIKHFGEVGFTPIELGGKTIFARDNRIGADFLGKGYHLIDDLTYRQLKEMVSNSPDKVLKATRFAGALSAALGIGGLIGTGINLINGD